MVLTIRTPSPTDAAALADLHVQTWRETYTHLLPENYFDEAFVQGRHEMWSRLTNTPREDLTVRLAELDSLYDVWLSTSTRSVFLEQPVIQFTITTKVKAVPAQGGAQ